MCNESDVGGAECRDKGKEVDITEVRVWAWGSLLGVEVTTQTFRARD